MLQTYDDTATRITLEEHYVGVSPQLLARVRQHWSAQGLDLDTIWRASVRSIPGFRPAGWSAAAHVSRPVDLLLLFDQGCAWIDTLRHLAGALHDQNGGRTTPEQRLALIGVTSRLREELASVRLLAIEGIAMSAMQISRSISEDVDLALLILIRKRIARRFVQCASPEDSAEFWRRHVAGGRAFRTVAQALYRHGLDHSDNSEYALWRKEVLVFLGSVVHTSSLTLRKTGAAQRGPLGTVAQECLSFATIRLQEMCAYAQVLGDDLREDLGQLDAADGLTSLRRDFALAAGEIILDQMRWLMDN